MKKFAFLSIVFLACAFSTAAQNRRVFDNFDVRGGVQIAVQPTAPPLPNQKNGKKNNAAAKNSVKPIVLTRALNPLKMTAGKNLGSFSTGDAKVDGYIVDSATRNNVDPLLVYATMSQESSFKPRAISNKGARGLMQLMPGTAARFGVNNIFDPKQNIEGGVRYLRFLLDTFNNDVRLALAGYNAGEGAVMKFNYTVPPYAETQNYVARISARYEMVRDPNYIRSIPKFNQPALATTVNVNQNPTVKQQQPVYEPAATAIRLSNGKIQLVTQ